MHAGGVVGRVCQGYDYRLATDYIRLVGIKEEIEL